MIVRDVVCRRVDRRRCVIETRYGDVVSITHIDDHEALQEYAVRLRAYAREGLPQPDGFPFTRGTALEVSDGILQYAETANAIEWSLDRGLIATRKISRRSA